jgi:hypothetical protein
MGFGERLPETGLVHKERKKEPKKKESYGYYFLN